MKTVTQTQKAFVAEAGGGSFAVDTAVVLFFLAFDCGQKFAFGVEGVLLALAVMAFVVLPYFLPSRGEKPIFEQWVLGRSALACIAIVLGVIFNQAVGVLLPDSFRFVPFTLLIVAGTISCYIQLFSFLKFRLAK